MFKQNVYATIYYLHELDMSSRIHTGTENECINKALKFHDLTGIPFDSSDTNPEESSVDYLDITIHIVPYEPRFTPQLIGVIAEDGKSVDFDLTGQDEQIARLKQGAGTKFSPGQTVYVLPRISNQTMVSEEFVDLVNMGLTKYDTNIWFSAFEE